MKKKKTMLAVAAAAALSIMLSSVPGVSADATNKYTDTDGTATNWLTGDGIKVEAGTSSYNNDPVYKDKDGHSFETAVSASTPTTVVKKILEIEDDAAIPSASFTITATAPTDDIAGDATHLPVKKGPNPEKIQWQAVDVGKDTASVAETKPYKFTDATGDVTTGAVGTVTYDANNPTGDVSAVAAGSPITTITDNNVLISAGGTGTYYAEKEVQLDFSGCVFTEPGVYRYILTETGTNTGVTNDETGHDADGNPTRTLDVYVEDATYYTRTGEEGSYTYTINPKLAITGFVLYKGTVETAPLKEGTTADDTATTLEDGSTVTGTSARAGETEKAKKSVGFKNTYNTNKLKITKTVTGNQGSRDQYFKFTLKSDTTSIPNDAVFYVSAVAADTSISNNLSAVNSATNSAYTTTVINAANKFTELTGTYAGLDSEKILGVFTGSDLKTGVPFYLQHDQYITVTGLPTGIGYTVTEVGEDYKVSYTAAAGTDKITADVLNTTSGVYTGDDITGSNKTGSVEAKDTLLRADAQVDFTNTKDGVIPTGVILSVAAPVIIGIIAVAGIIAIFMRKRRRTQD